MDVFRRHVPDYLDLRQNNDLVEVLNCSDSHLRRKLHLQRSLRSVEQRLKHGHEPAVVHIYGTVSERSRQEHIHASKERT